MKKIIYLIFLIQSGFMIAQSVTVPTINGKKVTFNPSASITSADNGLTATGNNIQLGGALTKPSVLTTTSAFTLAIKGLQTGASTDQLVTADANGVLHAIPNNYWSTKGNAGTVAGTNFIGTTDNADIVFKRYNVKIGYLTQNAISFGILTLNSLTTGLGNVAIGHRGLSSTTSGQFNTAFGDSALYKNTTGDHNVAMGANALYNNTLGNRNLAVGYLALENNSTGNNNSAIGAYSLNKNNTGTENTAIGVNSLIGLVTGNSNVGIGNKAGSTFYNGIDNALTAANNSVFIGYSSRAAADNGSNEIVIGYEAIGVGSNTVRIGNNQITKIEGAVAWSNPSDVRLKKDIVSSTHGLDFVSKLRPVTYHMKTGTTDLQSGFIAQEVETAAKAVNYEFSGLVKPASENDFYSLRYSEFVVPLVKAVQEQQQMIESQNADIAELKAQVQALLKAAK